MCCDPTMRSIDQRPSMCVERRHDRGDVIFKTESAGYGLTNPLRRQEMFERRLDQEKMLEDFGDGPPVNGGPHISVSDGTCVHCLAQRRSACLEI